MASRTAAGTSAGRPLRVLACEPYYGGSHRQFLDQWVAHSEHEFHCLTLPARWWKWRMRHAAIDFAAKIAELGSRFDVVFCSDMLNVAELRGLTVHTTGRCPHVLYFHENQLTYPEQVQSGSESSASSSGRAGGPGERDHHFAMVNVVSGAASDELWFNSSFHRDEFQEAVPAFLGSLPKLATKGLAERLERRSSVETLGVEDMWSDSRAQRAAEGPLRIGWVARWEHDKAPEVFFQALEKLVDNGVSFEVSLLGERFRHAPECFERFRDRHADKIARWGFLESREDYCAELETLDVVVSTARHEFFGIAVVEALMAGALPLFPARLSYPELIRGAEDLLKNQGAGLYAEPATGGSLGDESTARAAGSAEVSELSERLAAMATRKSEGTFQRGLARSSALRYSWSTRGPELDAALRRVADLSQRD